MSPLGTRLGFLPARVRKLSTILRVPSYRRALLHGSAAAVEHESVPFTTEFRTVLDVGANRGQFALVAARRFPAAALICFEPLPEPRARLGRALARHAQLTVIGRAVAAGAGTAAFVVAHADDSSSLLTPTPRQVAEVPSTGEDYRITVETASLDELMRSRALEAPVLLKIDVQGAELEVLHGAGETLAQVHSVLVECSFVELYRGQALADAVWAALHSHGFGVAAVCSIRRDRCGRPLEADVLFER